MNKRFLVSCAMAAAAATAAPLTHAADTCEIGARMSDGTICAGLSPDTTRPMYALPADASLTMNWQQAMDYAAKFQGDGHPKGTFRLPSQDELNLLFQNRARIGAFNETAGSYWSSTEHRGIADYAWGQKFDDGLGGWDLKSAESSLRLIRD